MSNRFLATTALKSLSAVAGTIVLLCGCTQSSAPTSMAAEAQVAATPAPSPFGVHASVKELMEAMVDPAADGVWESVGSTVTKKGIIDHQPRTPEEWQEVRLHAIALIESTNLLAMAGRRLVPEGGKILDEGEQGVLTTAEGEALLKSEHATFVQFARALHDVGLQMLKAIDAKQPAEMMLAGEAMDEVCEACHMKFWYPNQIVFKVSTSKEGAAH